MRGRNVQYPKFVLGLQKDMVVIIAQDQHAHVIAGDDFLQSFDQIPANISEVGERPDFLSDGE